MDGVKLFLISVTMGLVMFGIDHMAFPEWSKEICYEESTGFSILWAVCFKGWKAD